MTPSVASQKKQIEALEAENAKLKQELAIANGQIEILVKMVSIAGRKSGESDEAKAASAEAMSVFVHLSTKQHATLQMMMRGASNKEIAARMDVTESTAKVYVRAIMLKLGVNTRTQVVLKMRDVFDTMSPKEYERTTGIPMDWDKDWNPSSKVSKALRSKTR